MNARQFTLVMLSIACPLFAWGGAQAESFREIRLPLKQSLVVSASGETVDLDAVVTVSANTTSESSATNLDYTCEISGQATAASPPAYIATGLTSGTLQSDSPLPTDVGFSCVLALNALEISQTYQLRILASLGADGALTSAVVLDATPAP